MREQFRKQRMGARRARVQCARPVGRQLRFHKRLGAREIFDPGETVVLPPIPDTGLIHLPGEPFPSVHVDIQSERKPCLEARAHEPE